MVPYNAGWMGDPELPKDLTLRPDVDMTVEQFKFNSEEEGVEFIKNWWTSFSKTIRNENEQRQV